MNADADHDAKPNGSYCPVICRSATQRERRLRVGYGLLVRRHPARSALRRAPSRRRWNVPCELANSRSSIGRHGRGGRGYAPRTAKMPRRAATYLRLPCRPCSPSYRPPAERPAAQKRAQRRTRRCNERCARLPPFHCSSGASHGAPSAVAAVPYEDVIVAVIDSHSCAFPYFGDRRGRAHSSPVRLAGMTHSRARDRDMAKTISPSPHLPYGERRRTLQRVGPRAAFATHQDSALTGPAIATPDRRIASRDR